MQNILNNSQMRAADEYTVNVKGVPSEILMQRAGAAVAEAVLRRLKGGERVTVVCGTGNNGGDGYAAAQILFTHGADVKVFAFEGKLSEGCDRERRAYKGGYTRSLQADIIVDCIFGTGLSKNVSGEYAEVIENINSCGAYVISADIPSGLSGGNGLVMGTAVRADETVAIAEYKTGMFLNDGIDFCGKVVKRDIGIELPEDNYAKIFSDKDLKKFYPARKRNTHKGTYGSLNLVAGSDRYIGAAALSLSAALQSGCGLVKLTSTEKVTLALAAKFPQVIYTGLDLNSQAIALGMGSGVSEELYGCIKYILENFDGTFIIDADGLNTVSKYGKEILRQKKCKVILTPHLKEFSRLTSLSVGEISNNPVKTAQDFAAEYGVILLLKSATSVISDGKNTVINSRGSTALSKGGSGDMLAGFLGGTAARGLSPFEAAVCAAYTLGISAEISSFEKTNYCATAKDILKNLSSAVKKLTNA